jgi:hypothetical protein
VALGKEIFKKIKNRLCRRPLPGTLGTGFSQKNRKTVFADGLCQGRSAQVFFKKINPPSLLTALPQGAGPSAKKISKTVTLTRH